MKHEEGSVCFFFSVCAVLVILIDIIHIVSEEVEGLIPFSFAAELWRLVEVKGPWIRRYEERGSRTRVSGIFSVMALGHCYSESSCNAEEWPALACRAAT